MADIRWDELLPGRNWRPCGGASWAHLMQAPSAQLSHLLPRDYDGSCLLHAYSETLTVILRRMLRTNDICVDLPELLKVCLEKGVLRSNGTSYERLKDFIESGNGIPLQGFLPDDFVLVRNHHFQVDNPLGYISAMGTKLRGISGEPLPFGTPTAEQADATMTYREIMCIALEQCPVVLNFPLQEHYAEARNEGEPYRQREDRKFLDSMPSYYFGLLGTRRVYHSVTAYGYDCPSGDVRTLRIHYQENATGANGSAPGREFIDPDVVQFFCLPQVDDICFCNRPIDQ